MRISKFQLVIITILNVVIAALVAVIFLIPALSPVKGADSTDVKTNTDEPIEEQHNKLRGAADGRISDIVRETRLMGTGDETAVKVYTVDGVTYIFGNATVKGLDFDKFGGFLCTVNSIGSITGFTYLDGRITAVGKVGGGFAAATLSGADPDFQTSRLYYVGYDGAAKSVAALDGECVDIKAFDTRKVAVVTRPSENSFKLTEYAVSDGELWAAEHNTRISSGYTLDYFDCFKLGDGYILAARAYNLPRYDSIVFYTFSAGGDASAHFYGGSGENLMQPYAVLPYKYGYLALCRRDGVAAIVTVDYAFMSYHRDLLGFAFSSARLIDSADIYYACFECAGGNVVYEIDGNLSRRVLSAAGGMSLDTVVSSNGAVLAGEVDGKAKITDLSGSRVLALDITGVKFYGGYRSADGLTVLILSADGGNALTTASGGKDIYVIAVKL